MIKAFVFGKFLPFHKGHEAMIRFALQHCDRLTVLVCSSDKELVSGELRAGWIRASVGAEERVAVMVYDYEERILPNSSVSSPEISAIWAAIFKDLLPGHTMLVTSEPYGDYVAGFMGITHLPFDKKRSAYAVSSSAINANPAAYRHFLPDSVKPYWVQKVVILGTESTGKTTLANDLAAHFNAALVPEAARELIGDSNDFSMADLDKVAAQHAAAIAAAAEGPASLLIIDTDIHITRSYARHFFRTDLLVPDIVDELNKADLYLYLNNDVAYIQDGTRLWEDERNKLDRSHRETLSRYGVPFHEISGNWEERFRTAVWLIEALLLQGKKVR